jgi:hypothetical protein
VNLLNELAEDCDGVIFFGSTTILLPAPRNMQLLGFQSCIDAQMLTSIAPFGKQKPICWVVDFGNYRMDNLSDRLKFLNVQELRSRLLSTAMDHCNRMRWQWLLNNGVVIMKVKDKDLDEAEAFKRRVFLLEEVPCGWKNDNIFFTRVKSSKLMWFGVKNDGNTSQLEAPPELYKGAVSCIMDAARWKLSSFHGICSDAPNEAVPAMRILEELGFEVLRVDEFIERT